MPTIASVAAGKAADLDFRSLFGFGEGTRKWIPRFEHQIRSMGSLRYEFAPVGATFLCFPPKSCDEQPKRRTAKITMHEFDDVLPAPHCFSLDKSISVRPVAGA
jgi:hypothetical protein